MQTTSQIEAQISQVQRELKDIELSMARLSATQDLIDAHQELNNRKNVLGLLRERLELARQGEAREQIEREALEKAREEIQAKIEKLRAEFDSLLAPLEAQLGEVLPKLYELARARQSAQSRYSELGRKLRGSPDELGVDILVGNYGWTVKDEKDATKLRRLLLTLYRDAIGVAGGFKDINRLMPMLQMAQIDTPIPQIDTPIPQKQVDTLGTHLQDLGL
jgi:DNA repair exonuclease SbcCD ATPase subunit